MKRVTVARLALGSGVRNSTTSSRSPAMAAIATLRRADGRHTKRECNTGTSLAKAFNSGERERQSGPLPFFQGMHLPTPLPSSLEPSTFAQRRSERHERQKRHGARGQNMNNTHTSL